MGFNRRLLNVISIVQIIMSAIFLALGMADRYEARYIYTSYLFTPCWITALVLPAGIMGVIATNKSSSSSTLINALSSVSMTSAIVSGLTVYQYQQVLHGILISNFFSSYTGGFGEFTYFLDKDAPLKLTDQEDTTVAITSLVAVFSIIEVPLAVCAAWSSDSLYQPPQENQISQVGNVRRYNQFAAAVHCSSAEECYSST